jgi:enamine deaminase RidA (YjgF/YER057c/UK114 family)
MKQRTVIKPVGVHKPASPYSHAIVTSPGKSIYISGQVPVNAGGQVVSIDDFEAQVDQVFSNVSHIFSPCRESPKKPASALPRDRNKSLRRHPWRLDSGSLVLLHRYG